MTTPPKLESKLDGLLNDDLVSPALRAVDLLAAYHQAHEPPTDPLRLAHVTVFTLEAAGFTIGHKP